jgi:hypothetical protein
MSRLSGGQRPLPGSAASRTVDPLQSVGFLQGRPWLNAGGLVFRISNAAFRELRQTAIRTAHHANAVVPRHDCAGAPEYRRSR